MAFYYLEEPQFAMEQFLPFGTQRRFCHLPKSPRHHWNYQRVPNFVNELDNFFNEAEAKIRSEQRQFCSMKDYLEAIETMAKTMMIEQKETKKSLEVKKSDEKQEVVKSEAEKPVAKQEIVKQFGSKVCLNETMDKVEIKIDFMGHKFSGEHLDVQIIDGNVLIVKAEDGDKQFERKFKLPEKCNIEKVESKFSNKEEDKQTMTITIPKEVKIVQVPIAMDE